jgi:hypothetical protein
MVYLFNSFIYLSYFHRTCCLRKVLIILRPIINANLMITMNAYLHNIDYLNVNPAQIIL